MATKRLATAALRGVCARPTVSATPLPQASRLTSQTSRTLARQQLPRSTALGRAWYSSEPTTPQSQFWDFEKIKVAIKSSSPRVTLVDVREPDEVSKTGRIPGAVNVPVMSQPDSFNMSAEDFRDRYGFERPSGEGENQVVFYCKAGVRSRAAVEIARNAGWKNLGEYPGSWNDWVANGGDIQIGGKVRKGKVPEAEEK
ncbi:Rhodanese-like protein [Annulohypoxylon stygium]|nr:Rhodanese-like protein [Annulohypoxylon stygium]